MSAFSRTHTLSGNSSRAAAASSSARSSAVNCTCSRTVRRSSGGRGGRPIGCPVFPLLHLGTHPILASQENR